MGIDLVISSFSLSPAKGLSRWPLAEAVNATPQGIVFHIISVIVIVINLFTGPDSDLVIELLARAKKKGTEHL